MNTSAAEAFSKQAVVFDSLEAHHPILKWMRDRVHAHALNYFKPGDSILELNCGTGMDAVFFAEHGMHVFATDISENMLNEVRKKISIRKLEDRISVQQCSFENLSSLQTQEKKFKHIFSDFGGLNCAENIESVISQFPSLLDTGGTATLVMMPKICPWELLLALKGNFKTAFRRLKRNGTQSNVEGISFTTHYHSPGKIIRAFGKQFYTDSLKSLGCFTPPPYLENVPEKFPRMFQRLKSLDEKTESFFPFNRCADHFILTMRRIK